MEDKQIVKNRFIYFCRIGIYEILYRADIPFSVSVNEAVELAKRYSNDDAGAFVNGLLAKVSEADTPEKTAEAENGSEKSDSDS